MPPERPALGHRRRSAPKMVTRRPGREAGRASRALCFNTPPKNRRSVPSLDPPYEGEPPWLREGHALLSRDPAWRLADSPFEGGPESILCPGATFARVPEDQRAPVDAVAWLDRRYSANPPQVRRILGHLRARAGEWSRRLPAEAGRDMGRLVLLREEAHGGLRVGLLGPRVRWGAVGSLESAAERVELVLRRA